MHSFTSTLALLSVAALAAAQGRYACSIIDNTGAVVPMPSMCNNPVPDAAPYPAPNGGVNGGLATGGNLGAYKQNGAVPTMLPGSCVVDTMTGNYYCAYIGAPCTSAANCDNGVCDTASGTCQGGLGMTCNGNDANCIGHLYCVDPSGLETDSDVCGGNSAATSAAGGAYCDDSSVPNHSETNNFCLSHFCDIDTSACGILPAASQRSRSRRSDVATRGARCPASHTACAVTGAARGFECVDVTSNLEQCGACASEGGVDCTAIAGVDAVGCVAGKCEIWACAEGFAWDASSASCTVALTM